MDSGAIFPPEEGWEKESYIVGGGYSDCRRGCGIQSQGSLVSSVVLCMSEPSFRDDELSLYYVNLEKGNAVKVA